MRAHLRSACIKILKASFSNNQSYELLSRNVMDCLFTEIELVTIYLLNVL